MALLVLDETGKLNGKTLPSSCAPPGQMLLWPGLARPPAQVWLFLEIGRGGPHPLPRAAIGRRLTRPERANG